MEKIAVVGIAGKYPDAKTPESLFKNLLSGKSSIKRFSEYELNKTGIPNEVYTDKNYRPFGTNLNGYKKFDNDFFKMTPYESKLTDPQQRLFLECSYQALQNAGYNPFKVPGRVGVFGSQGATTYLQKNIMQSEYYHPNKFEYSVVLGNDLDSLATRVSYRLNLKGPSLTIQTGCSSSLVGLNYAIKSIQFDECDMALVGGVNLCLPQSSGYFFTEGSTFSDSGKVSPFDENADGMVLGSGCSVVVLKGLENALKDHNYIYGVIDGIGINNDGSGKVGYTAPSVRGQSDAIKIAIQHAHIDAKQIEYIEAHGTGTKMGDPIEFRALSKVYGNKNTDKLIKIGSLKANIGHLDVAAGLTGFIKDLLILKNKVIPKQINFHNLNKT